MRRMIGDERRTRTGRRNRGGGNGGGGGGGGNDAVQNGNNHDAKDMEADEVNGDEAGGAWVDIAEEEEHGGQGGRGGRRTRGKGNDSEQQQENKDSGKAVWKAKQPANASPQETQEADAPTDDQ